MSNAATALKSLRRPKTLIKAARYGATRYQRDRDLRRIGAELKSTPQRARLADWLLAEEQTLEDTRTGGDGTYSVQRHITVLAALIVEATALAADTPQDNEPPKGRVYTNASGSAALRVVT